MSISTIESKIKSDPYNPIHHIALAKAYLEQGDEERARRVIAIQRRLPSKDPSVHFKWGLLCEELGMARQARESYEQAIALDPGNADYHFRLARLCYEKGAWERALRHLQKTVALSPENEAAREMLVTLYREMGLQGSANAVAKKATSRDSSPQTIPLQVTQEDVSLLLDLFNGRELGYAEYHLVSTGNEGYVYCNNALGFGEVADHLRGEKTMGVYLLRGDQTLRCCGIHIQIPWNKLASGIKDAGSLSILEDKVRTYARDLRSKAKELGFSSYCEDSADRGRRIWFFFEDFIPYEMAERLLNSLIDRVSLPGLGLSLQLLLGFKLSGIGKTDEPAMLPLGIRRRTGKRSLFIDEAGNPYDDQLLFLRKIRRITRLDLQRFFKGPDRERRRIEVSSSDLFTKLQKRCSIVEAIVLKAASGRSLRTEEKMVLYFTVGFLPESTRILHDILEPCPDYRPNRVNRMMSRLCRNPISCPKIRQLVPEMTAYLSCKCSFDLRSGLYPTPLLHIDPALVNIEPRTASAAGSLEEIEKRYASILRKIDQLTREKKKLEGMLEHLRAERSLR